MLVVFVGPSCSGKTTLADMFVQRDKAQYLPSYTTRNPREGEENQTDYVFINKEQFSQLRESGAFIWTVSFRGEAYGTRFSDIQEALSGEALYVACLRPDGVNALYNYTTKNGLASHLKIFYVLCSGAELVERLRRDRRLSPEAIEKELVIAEQTMQEVLSGEYLFKLIETQGVSPKKSYREVKQHLSEPR